VDAANIRGADEARVRAALAGGVEMMSSVKLTEEEIKAVVSYLQTLK
jgi:cytochrome c1